MKVERAPRTWTYTPEPGPWDEAVRAETGLPRKHWRALAAAFGRMGARAFDQHWRTGQQLIQSNGITFNVYDDPQGKERPWPMDPIPMVLDQHEWASIERAVVQRATLLNAMLADLYGPQTLVRNRTLPPALLFANPHFLRPVSGIQPAGGVYLHAYAVDLARSPDGRWWVIADRTQAPSGMGYALENRLVAARTFPQVFMQCQVRQLTRYFQSLRDALLALAPGNKSMPRAVLLTPGPHNETYFEHAFLARHYNFPLVESADLTVRDDRVYLKTLAGLEPIDLIVRRQDDAFCDPLELRSDSVLGVPGLVQAARRGNVAIANALGSGLVQTPAHMAFLEGLCRNVLGEDLRMPSVATWWCGQQGPRRYVLDHLRELVIKPTFPRFDRRAVFAGTLDDAALARLREEIEANPEQYVAQEKIALSTAPCWDGQTAVPRHVVMRIFAAWDGESYTVMPGGLTRVSTSGSSLVVSLQMGGGSKDTWVLGGAAEPAAAPAKPSRSAAFATRKGSNVSSRAADNLFWLGRYAERVESIVRLVRVMLPALSGEEDFGQSVSLDTAVHMLAAFRHLPKEIFNLSIAEQRRQTERLLTDIIYDPTRMSGLGWNLKQVRRVAWQLKERLSADTWRVLQQLEADLSRTPPSRQDQRFVAQMNLLDSAIGTISAFAGLVMENTTRGPGWGFLDIGRRLERGLQMGLFLKNGLVAAPDLEVAPYLEALLQIADSSMTYRSRYMTELRADLVLDLLLVDELNPRSIGFQVATLADHVRKLPEREEASPQSRYPLEQRLALKALTAVRLARVEELAEPDDKGQRAELARLLETLQNDLLDVSEALTAKYLTHLAPSRLIASL